MLNLTIAMLAHKESYLLFIIGPWLVAQLLFSQGSLPGSLPGRLPVGITSLSAWLAATSTPEPQLIVGSPHPGEALQGAVSIGGTTELPGFRSAEVTFAYQSDPTGTWFLIQQSSKPVK